MTRRHYEHILHYLRSLIRGTKWESHLYAVGGCVRDEIMGREIQDIDIAVDLPNGGIMFARWLSQRCLTEMAPIYYFKFGTAKLFLRQYPNDEIELVQTRAEQYNNKNSRNPEVVFGDIRQDCYRRDFTVNTLYRNISTGEILDITGRAEDDIKKGILRTPMNPHETFEDDPVRILRCLRFAARFNWKIEKSTKKALIANIPRLALVSNARWSGEFQKMLLGSNLSKSLGELASLGGFKYMNQLTREMSEFKPYGGEKSVLSLGLEDAISLEKEGVKDPVRRLAAFFGYAGMIRTEVHDRDGSIRYPRHELIGAAMTGKYLKQMGLLRDITDPVVSMITEKGERRRIAEQRQRIEAHHRRQMQQHEERLKRRERKQQNKSSGQKTS